jgi:hypothetical protein
MSDNREPSTAFSANGDYARAVPTTSSIATATAVATVPCQTITASRLEGKIRVRLVPSAPTSSGTDETY